jgi:hypothetical protein
LNRSPDAFGILHNFIRAEANDPPSHALHHRGASSIRFDLVSVMLGAAGIASQLSCSL